MAAECAPWRSIFRVVHEERIKVMRLSMPPGGQYSLRSCECVKNVYVGSGVHEHPDGGVSQIVHK